VNKDADQRTNQFLSIDTILIPNRDGKICEQAKQIVTWPGSQLNTTQFGFDMSLHGMCEIKNWMASLILAQDKRWRRA
jgi:hypothetical protein